MHDFNCTDADDMNYKLMADRTRYLKENTEGIKEISAIMEEMIYEANYQLTLEIAKRLIARGKNTLEEIAEDTGLELNKVQELAVSK